MEDNAIHFRQNRIIPALDHSIFKSDTLFSPSMKFSLQASLRHLEWTSRRDKGLCFAGPETRIVNPYLYPLIFGRTRIVNSAFHNLDDCIKLCGEGSSGVFCAPQDQECGSLDGGEQFCGDTSYNFCNAWSVRFQWLPCDVSFETETGKAR